MSQFAQADLGEHFLYWQIYCPFQGPVYLMLNLFPNARFQTFPNWKNLQTIILNLMKMAESSPNGRKDCGKRRNCSLRAISSFPIVFSKDLYFRHVKKQSLFGKGLNISSRCFTSNRWMHRFNFVQQQTE